MRTKYDEKWIFCPFCGTKLDKGTCTDCAEELITQAIAESERY